MRSDKKTYRLSLAPSVAQTMYRVTIRDPDSVHISTTAAIALKGGLLL